MRLILFRFIPDRTHFMSNMFERPLYEYEPVAAPVQQEGDMFRNYEIKGWLSRPGLFKVLGASAVLNIVALLVVAQTSLLTMKGCDSPLVGSVCQVLDTVYVGSMLFGTDREYVDAAYDKIPLGEDSEITYIDASNVTPPLEYPAGYFQIANPEEFAVVDDTNLDGGLFGNGVTQDIPGIPNGLQYAQPSTDNNLFNTAPVLPTPNPNVIDENTLPSSNGNQLAWTKSPKYNHRWTRDGKKPPLISASPGSTPEGPDPEGLANLEPSPDASPTVVPSPDPTGPVPQIEITKRPLLDLADTVNGLLDKKMVNLEDPFQIQATGKLGKDGKFDSKTFRYTKALPENSRMVEVVQEAVEAVNESNFLQYLSMFSGKDLSFEIMQDDKMVVATVVSEFDSDLRANTMSTLLTQFIATKRAEKEAPTASQNDKEDLVFLQNARVEHPGKKLVVTFTVPKANVQTIIMRRLAERRAEPKAENTNGSMPPSAEPAKTKN